MSDLIEDPIAGGSAPQAKKNHPKKVRTESESLKKFREITALASAGGPPEKIAAQKAKGKLTARERIGYLAMQTERDPFRRTRVPPSSGGRNREGR